MSIESEIFKRVKANPKKLTKYGFIKEGKGYRYEKSFMDDSFKAVILIVSDK